jgi:hypothetical protein
MEQAMKNGKPRITKLPGIVVAILLSWWLVVPAHALTAAEIITQARVLLNDSSADTARQRFSDAQLLSFINDGQREANILSGWVLKSSYTVALVVGTTEYALPSDYLTTWRVTLDGKKLYQTNFNQLDADSIGWNLARGKPSKYYTYFKNTPVIGFQPAPTTASTGTAVIYYNQQPTEITSTSSSPWNGWIILSPYHSGLIYYLAYRGYLILLDDKLAMVYFNEYSVYVNSMKEAILKMPDFNPGLTGSRIQ